MPYVLVSQLHEDRSGEEYRSCLYFVSDQGYRQAPSDPNRGGLVDREWLKSVEAVFYDIPYDRYHVDEFLTSKYLPFAYNGYLPYGVRNLDVEYVDWLNPTVRNCSRYYCETEWHRQFNVQKLPSVGARSIVTGYPTTFRILQDSRVNWQTDGQAWSPPTQPPSNVLWAPHWSWALSAQSAWVFLRYHQALCRWAQKGRIVLWYRPHPLLNVRLKALNPYQFRAEGDAFLEGTPYQDATGIDYVELFTMVDLIVHNSGSFLSEFLATGKPAIFITEDSFIESNSGDFGRRALEACYQVNSELQLNGVLESLLDLGIDDLLQQRQDFAFYLDNEMSVDPIEAIARDLEQAFHVKL